MTSMLSDSKIPYLIIYQNLKKKLDEFLNILPKRTFLDTIYYINMAEFG